MMFSITIGLVVFVVVVAFLFIARRMLRLALKLAVVGVIVFVLVAGAAFGWWRGWFSSSSANARQTNQANRTNVNRRPASR